MKFVAIMVLSAQVCVGLAPAGWCFLGCSSRPAGDSNEAARGDAGSQETPRSCCSRCEPQAQSDPEPGDPALLRASQADVCACLDSPCCASTHAATTESLESGQALPELELVALVGSNDCSSLRRDRADDRAREAGPAHAGLPPYLELERLLL